MGEQDDWHSISAEESIKRFGVDLARGLTADDAAARLSQFGQNAIPVKKELLIVRLLEPFTEPMMILLLIVGIIYSFVGELMETAAIFTIIAIIGMVEAFQEIRTERSVEALQRLTAPRAILIRDSREVIVEAEYLVPGDIAVLTRENRIPADLRLIESWNLDVDESILTGESSPVTKEASKIVDRETPLAERVNMAYSGTLVTKGRGKGIVVATGLGSSMGKIAALTSSIKREATPLQEKMRRFTFQLAMVSVLIAASVAVIGVLRGQTIVQMLLVGLTLAVATIPEDIPILLTVILLASVWRMGKKSALSRSIYAPETLGSTTVICTDKTGTITENRLSLVAAYVQGHYIDLTQVNNSNDPALKSLIQAATLASDIPSTKYEARMDPIDFAIMQMATRAGIETVSEKLGLKLVEEAPFDERRKFVSKTYFDGKDNRHVYVKGASESLLPLCSKYLWSGSFHALDEERTREILGEIGELAGRGLRVLAVASSIKAQEGEAVAKNELSFLGLIGMFDMPREGVKEAVEECKRAGIRVLMLTGDHPNTALAVAKEIGLANVSKTVTGGEIESLPDEKLIELIRQVDVYSRLEPRHKLRIVKTLKNLGEVVAVTGDGANDAPSLKQADAGVAMGLRGTDVAREASSLILTDDNFSTIVEAVREGRRGHDNLRKALHYYISNKIAILSIIFFSILMGYPPALLPIQVIFQEVFGDVIVSTCFASEPMEPDAMRKPVRRRKEQLIDRSLFISILVQGAAIFAVIFTLYSLSITRGTSPEKAQTMAFTVFMMTLVFLAFNSRYLNRKLMYQDLLANKHLNKMAAVTIAAAIVVINLPQLQSIFKTVPLGFTEWAAAIGLALLSTILFHPLRTRFDYSYAPLS